MATWEEIYAMNRKTTEGFYQHILPAYDPSSKPPIEGRKSGLQVRKYRCESVTQTMDKHEAILKDMGCECEMMRDTLFLPVTDENIGVYKVGRIFYVEYDFSATMHKAFKIYPTDRMGM